MGEGHFAVHCKMQIHALGQWTGRRTLCLRPGQTPLNIHRQPDAGSVRSRVQSLLLSASGRRSQIECHGLRDFDAVDGRRVDTTGIPGAFAGRIQPFDVHALVIASASNPDR